MDNRMSREETKQAHNGFNGEQLEEAKVADPPRNNGRPSEAGGLHKMASDRSGAQNAEKMDTRAKREEEPEKKISGLMKRYWDKLGITPPMLMMMFKGSIAPIIAISMYQADAVANHFASIGYLIPIITIISFPILPRAKFFQTMILNILGICVGSAVGLLGMWSAIQARKHTAPPGSSEPYNSSQSTVCAIWLFANIYIVNTIRGNNAAYQFPVIMYSILVNVAFIYGPHFTEMTQAISLIKRLLESFLTAFALASGVNLFIFPMTSRTVIFKSYAGYLGAIRGTLKAQTAYLESLEGGSLFSGPPEDEKDDKKSKKGNGSTRAKDFRSPQATALQGAVKGLKDLHGKIYGDLPFAKREIAWGKLNAEDISKMFLMFRNILIPLTGLSTIIDIFERLAERREWVPNKESQLGDLGKVNTVHRAERDKEKQVWNEVMKTLHDPFAIVAGAMDEGLEHVGLLLELTPRLKKKKGVDVEAKGDESRPGDLEFSKVLEERLKDFYSSRGNTLRTWARERGLSEDQFDKVNDTPIAQRTPEEEKQHFQDQYQLYLILYMEFLLYSVGRAVFIMIKFAEKKAADGTMKKSHLIVPGQKRLWKWITSIGQEDSSLDQESPDSLENGSRNVYMGAGFNPVKDPEHLPPQTAWQHFGNVIRYIPRFLGSTESAFGFRVACATLTVGIVAFLRDTEAFFVEQRLVWAMIIIAIGMTMTSGQSIFGFLGRVAGTALSMVFAFIIWYIVDEKTVGVIVFLWLFIFLEMILVLKYFRFIGTWIVCMVTQCLILAYELQVRKIGVERSESSGQPYYPIYLFAPYRLACVAGGSFVAFIWTIFPYPISDRSWLRRDLGATLYMLANYQAAVHATIRSRSHGTEGNMELKSSPGRRLEKVRSKIFGKLLILLPSLAQHAEWEKWEPTIGGKFPREIYEEIIHHSNNLIAYLSLASYSTQSISVQRDFNYPEATPSCRSAWLNDLNVLTDKIGPTSHSITSTLILLSAAVTQGSALPPYLQLPGSFNLSKRLEALDRGILDARHVEEPGYSAYAVLQITSSLISDDLAALAESVKRLVGETDFSLRVDDSQTNVGSSGSSDGEGSKGKRD